MPRPLTSTPQTSSSSTLSLFFTPTEGLDGAKTSFQGLGAPQKNHEARPEVPGTFFRERLAFQSPPTRSDISSTFSSPGLDASGVADNRCAICLGGIQKPARVNCCLHEYHFNCIMIWSQTQDTCPICRSVFTKIYECATKVDAPDVSCSAGELIEWSITSAPSGSTSAITSLLSNTYSQDGHHGVPQMNWSSEVLHADEDWEAERLNLAM